LKYRSEKINKIIQNNFEILNSKINQNILEKNLIFFLYSMPLVRTDQMINEIYEYDLDRYFRFYGKLKSFKESE